jgi:hypothetical protein
MYDQRAVKLDPDRAVATMVHDTHTTPQAPWLHGFAPKTFKLENIHKLWSHIGITAYVHVHVQKRKWSVFDLEPRHEKQIMDYYADDMILYDNAE